MTYLVDDATLDKSNHPRIHFTDGQNLRYHVSETERLTTITLADDHDSMAVYDREHGFLDEGYSAKDMASALRAARDYVRKESQALDTRITSVVGSCVDHMIRQLETGQIPSMREE